MKRPTKHAVTGAFGYSGKYIAKRLLAEGHEVITLTNSPSRANPFGNAVAAYPYNFDNPARLTESLQDVRVLYNTYWVRFNHALFKHADAVANTKTLFACAKEAGVERVVHVSITNPSPTSSLEYFTGKWELEEALCNSDMSYAILRPAVLFGKEDILINNIAYLIRRLPVFGIFGKGDYRLQPIYVDDLAKAAVEEGARRKDVVREAIGPETYTYRELVSMIAETLGIRRAIISVPPLAGYIAGSMLGALVGDVLITKDEIEGLMADLLAVDNAPPMGETALSDWVREHKETLGARYASELRRRKDRTARYIVDDNA